MTERALSAIRTGRAAALEKCRALADQINAELLERQKIAPFALAELQANLARANAEVEIVTGFDHFALGPVEFDQVRRLSAVLLIEKDPRPCSRRENHHG
jgi:hypothetical protein